MSAVVVFGGTGYAGSRIVAEAVRRGHRVTVVARTRPAEVPTGAVFVSGSLFDADLRDPLIADADVVAISVRSRHPDGAELADAVPAVLAQAARHGTRIGVVGGAGSLSTEPGGPSRLEQMEIPDPTEPRAAESLAHAGVLQVLRGDGSGADWFYLSPPLQFGAHVPGVTTGSYRVGGDVVLTDAQGRSQISGEDYALAFVDEIDSPRHHRARFTVAH